MKVEISMTITLDFYNVDIDDDNDPAFEKFEEEVTRIQNDCEDAIHKYLRLEEFDIDDISSDCEVL